MFSLFNLGSIGRFWRWKMERLLLGGCMLLRSQIYVIASPNRSWVTAVFLCVRVSLCVCVNTSRFIHVFIGQYNPHTCPLVSLVRHSRRRHRSEAGRSAALQLCAICAGRLSPPNWVPREALRYLFVFYLIYLYAISNQGKFAVEILCWWPSSFFSVFEVGKWYQCGTSSAKQKAKYYHTCFFLDIGVWRQPVVTFIVTTKWYHPQLWYDCNP